MPIQKYCRICVLPYASIVDLSETFEGSGKKSTLLEIYNECCPIKITFNDPYPKKICINCLSSLLKTYEFRQKCLQAVDLLIKKFKKVTPKRVQPAKLLAIKRKTDLLEPSAGTSKEINSPKTPQNKRRKTIQDIIKVLEGDDTDSDDDWKNDVVQVKSDVPKVESVVVESEEENEIDFENVIAKNELILEKDEEIEAITKNKPNFHKIDPNALALTKMFKLPLGTDLKSLKIVASDGTPKKLILKHPPGKNEDFKNLGKFQKVNVDGVKKFVYVALKDGEEIKDEPKSPRIFKNTELGHFKYSVLQAFKNASNIVYEANGFLYTTSRITQNRRYLRCSTKNCPSKALITSVDDRNDNEELQVYKIHNHPKEILNIAKLKFLEEIRVTAAEGRYTPRQVYDITIKKYPDLSSLMPYNSLTSRLYRLSTTVGQPIDITSLYEFGVYLKMERPKKYCHTLCNKPFFQDFIVNDDLQTCSIIFANTDLIENMSYSTELFVDSSFNVSIDGSNRYKFLTICVAINEHRFPVFFALMENNSKADYIKILKEFRDTYAPNLHPNDIITDYNANLFKALDETYPHSQICGSLVHYIFYVYKQCNVANIIKDIELKADCMKLQSHLFTLPILPPDLIPAALQHIHAEASDDEREIFADIFNYIEETWCGYVTSDLFSMHANQSRVCEGIFNTYKKIRDVVSSSKKYGYFEFAEKLITIEDFVNASYKKVVLGQKIQRQYSSTRFLKTLNKVWAPKHVEKNGFKQFFEMLAPLIEKMTGLIWIWGFYNYEGSNDDELIGPDDLYGPSDTMDDEQINKGDEVITYELKSFVLVPQANDAQDLDEINEDQSNDDRQEINEDDANQQQEINEDESNDEINVMDDDESNDRRDLIEDESIEDQEDLNTQEIDQNQQEIVKDTQKINKNQLEKDTQRFDKDQQINKDTQEIIKDQQINKDMQEIIKNQQINKDMQAIKKNPQELNESGEYKTTFEESTEHIPENVIIFANDEEKQEETETVNDTEDNAKKNVVEDVDNKEIEEDSIETKLERMS